MAGGGQYMGLIGQGVAHTGQYFMAGSQWRKGRRLEKSLGPRPQLTTPEAYTEALNQAKAQAALNEMPGQQLAEEKLGVSTGAGVRSMEQGASSSAALMAGVAGLKGVEQENLTNTLIAGAEFQDLNKQRLQEALWKYGGEEKEQFYQNKFDPWAEKKAEAAALKGAAMQNVSNTLDKTASSMGGASSSGMFSKGGGGSRMGGGGASGGGGESGGGGYAPGFTSATPTNGTRQMGATGQSNQLGAQSNVQKYLTAKRSGFTGSYNEWIAQQPAQF